MTKITIIGGGISSLSASCYLAQAGYEVTLIEKNATLGGRARQLKRDGFTFDIGPTFYWMPDVMESFFNDFKHQSSDFYQLERLNPSYRVYFNDNQSVDISADMDEIYKTFENIEKGSADKLKSFLNQSKDNYNLAIRDLVYQPGNSIWEIITFKTAKKIGLFFRSIQDQVFQLFKDTRLRQITTFPVLFLGAKPSNTPAFYNFMNYADFELGTWHPQGGMYELVKGMSALASKLGVQIKTSEDVLGFEYNGNQIVKVLTNKSNYDTDAVVSGADYAFTESLLPENLRQYTTKYWETRTFAPSALLFYIGFDSKIEGATHHSLFFDTDFESHSQDIYDNHQWPQDPLFYVSFPSVTDSSSAPDGKEAAIILIPISINIEDTPEIRAQYLDLVLNRMSARFNQDLKKHILFTDSYCIQDFKKDYNSYGGNAYGLANTLLQTHILRPKIKSKKIKNLYFTGQLTVPGPGIPPSIISGKIVANEIIKRNETAF